MRTAIYLFLIFLLGGCVDPQANYQHYLQQQEQKKRDYLAAHADLPEYIRRDLESGLVTPEQAERARLAHIEFAKERKETEAVEKRLREDYVAQHASLKPEIKTAISNKQICVGMAPDDVKASWGKPQIINASNGVYGSHDQWVYWSETYLYFEDGVLTSWQMPKAP